MKLFDSKLLEAQNYNSMEAEKVDLEGRNCSKIAVKSTNLVEWRNRRRWPNRAKSNLSPQVGDISLLIEVDEALKDDRQTVDPLRESLKNSD